MEIKNATYAEKNRVIEDYELSRLDYNITLSFFFYKNFPGLKC